MLLVDAIESYAETRLLPCITLEESELFPVTPDFYSG